MNWVKLAGYTCVTITYISLGLGFYFFVIRLGFRWARSNWLLWYPVFDIAIRLLMAAWSHMQAWLGDPGFVRPEISDSKKPDGENTCKKCFASKPPRTHHCSTCNSCVERMDHHCPWINQCVGMKNHKAFLLFLAYTCSAAIECLILTVVRAATCPSIADSVMLFLLRFAFGEKAIEALIRKGDTKDERFAVTWNHETCNLTTEYAISGAVAFGLAFTFVIFIAFIASDQLYTIRSNQTHVEFLKGEKGPERTIKQALVETLGMEPSLWWLVPIDWRWKSVPLVASVVEEKKHQ